MTKPLEGLQRFPAPLGNGTRTFRIGKYALYSTYTKQVAVDLTQWPPAINVRDNLDLRAVDTDTSAGRYLVHYRDASGNSLELRDGRPFPPGDRLSAPLCSGAALPLLEAVALFDDRFLAVPSHNGPRPGTMTAPSWVTGGALEPAEGFAIEATSSQDQRARGLGRLADGSRVVVWNGDGYELRDGRFERTFVLEALRSHAPFTTAPWDRDGLYYLSNRSLFRARRGGVPEPVATPEGNVMSVAPGPGGTLLLEHGDNPSSFVASVLRPDDGARIGLGRSPLAMERWMALDGLVYSEATERVYAHSGGLLTVPAASLLAALKVPRKVRSS